MQIRNDADILRLISCAKNMPTRIKKPAEINRNVTQKFKVVEYISKAEFDVFITFSSRMPMDFSIGLMYNEFLLYRCNGFHGTTISGFYAAEHHAYPHAHILTMEDIENNRSGKPSRHIDLTGKYVDLHTARLYFFEHCGILGYEKFFPRFQQIPLIE